MGGSRKTLSRKKKVKILQLYEPKIEEPGNRKQSKKQRDLKNLSNQVKSKFQIKVYLYSERFRLKFLKGHITWVLAVLHFAAEFQMEPLAPNTVSYDTGQTPTRPIIVYNSSLVLLRG